MKKNLFSALAFCMLFTAAYGQAVKNKDHSAGQQPVQRCATNEHELMLQQKNPSRAAERELYEQAVQSYITNARQGQDPSSQGGTIVIPVVVHVVWNTAAQNISDNQIFSQIQVLNEDFGRTNPDASNTPAYWTSIAANTDIQYCLATQDPNGLPTNGIERRQIATNVSFNTNDNVKFFASNGLDAWDPTRYLNLWVCNLGSGLLGYGEFPTGSVSNTFGLVMGYTCFGSNFTSYGSGFNLLTSYNRGRTSTHEIGHCFDLYHIWGDDGSSCSGSDQCADTPNQADEHYGCPSGSQVSCSNGPNGDMYQNYMDYSDDVCMNLFTLNQKARMLAVLNNPPYNALQTSNGCTPLTSGPNDAGIDAVVTPTGTICGVTFSPVVTLKNWGANTLTSVTINYRIDLNTVQTYSWSGSLATGNTVNVTLPSMTTTAATHTFTCYTSNPNSATDGNTANDQSTSSFTCMSSGQALPYFQGFEGTTFVPTGWTLNNPDGMFTWDRTTSCSRSGVACARMDNWSYQGGNGQRDEMTMPALNLSTVASPVMTFEVAYTYWTVPYQYSDTLEVLVSTDCGATWTTVYKKWGANLQTATPVSSNSAGWVPSSSAQWRMETVSLLPYQSSSALMIRFRNITDYEDNLYLDDINIMNSTDVPQLALGNSVSLFPNPSQGIFNLNVALGAQKDLGVTVTNSLGQVVTQFTQSSTYGGLYTLDLSQEANGVYFVEVYAGEERTVQRIVINR